MKHSKLTRHLGQALLALLLLAAAHPLAAEQIDYAKLWHGLTGPEKEILVIGYARGLKWAEAAVSDALAKESDLDPIIRRRLSARSKALSAGLTTSEEVRAVVECLDKLYAESQNQYIDWTDFVAVARLRAENSDDQADAELNRLRRCEELLQKIHQQWDNADK